MRMRVAVVVFVFTLFASALFAQTVNPPAGVRVLAGGTFGLMWDYVDSVDGFQVRARPAAGGADVVIATVPGSAMLSGQVAALGVPLPTSGTWDLTVVAYSGSGTSVPSNIVRVFVPDPATVQPCTYIPSGATVPETRPIQYLLIGRIVYDNADGASKTAAALRVQQFVKWGWLLTPWPEVDPVDGKTVLRIRAWCRSVPGLQ